MKSSIRLSLLAALGFGLTAPLAHAALSVAPGDLLLGFFQVSADGTSAAGDTYIYNLGSGSDLRESGGTGVVDNINADLTTVFGGGWAANTNIRWGVVGVISASQGLTDGDPGRTNYFSQGFDGDAGSSPVITLSLNQRGSLAVAADTFSLAMNGIPENGAVDGGAVYSSSGLNSFSSFLPPSSGTSFGIGASPVISIGSGADGLDIYRILHSTAGADLTAAASPDNAIVGRGQYIGSVTLSPTGDLSVIPEPSTALLGGVAALAALRRRRAVS